MTLAGEQAVQAQVVLSADNSQYDQTMQQSAQQTDALANKVDSLTGKINNLAKSAGKKLIGAGAFDVVGLTAATAAYAAWDDQMKSLHTQAAVLTKTMSDQKSLFNSYAGSVDNIRRTFATSTADAAALVQTLSRMSDQTSTVNNLAASFEKLGNTVQESPTALASGMLQLQRTMGNAQTSTDKYNQQLAVLSMRSNAGAQAILDFSNNIAPVARLLNMSQTEVMGFSNAFIKAGQDGMQAANVFQTMVTQIAQATQSGSPDLAKYANLVGMTVGQFKNLQGSDKIMDIFDAINRQGPAAITTLNRMGLDGQRTVRAITAMASQPGGIAAEIQAANNAPSDTTSKGNAAAMDDMVTQLKRMRIELTQTAEAIGSVWAPVITHAASLMADLAGAARMVADSPFGKLATMAAGIAAPMVAAAGAVLMMVKALTIFSGFNMLRNGAFFTGFKAQRNLAATGGLDANGNPLHANIENDIADGKFKKPPNFIGRAMYDAGARASRLGRFGVPRDESMFVTATRGINRSLTGGETGYTVPGALYSAAGAASRLYGEANFGSGAYNDFTQRPRVFNAEHFSDYGLMGKIKAGYYSAQAKMGLSDRSYAFPTRDGSFMSYEDAFAVNDKVKGLQGSRLSSLTSTTEKAAEAEKLVMATSKTAVAMQQVEKATVSASKGLGSLASGLGSAGALFARTAGNAGKMGAGVASSAFSGLFGANPWMLGLTAAGIGLPMIMSMMHSSPSYQYQNNQSDFNPYLQAGGVQVATASTPLGTSMTSARTTDSAMRVSSADIAAANDSAYKPKTTALKGLSVSQAITRLSPMYQQIKGSPTALNSLKLDLVNQYGASSASQILQHLGSGSGYDPSSLISATYGSGRDTALKNLAGTFSTETNNAFVSGGNQAVYKTQGSQFQTVLSAYGANNGINATVAGKTVIDPNHDTRIAANKFMAKQFLGIDLSDSAAQQIKVSSNMKTYLRDMLGHLGSSDMDNALASAGLSTALNGNAAVNALVNHFTNPAPNKADTSSAQYRMGQFATGMYLNSNAANTAIQNQGNQNDQYKAINSIMQGIGNLSVGRQLSSLSRVRAIIGTDDDPQSQLAIGAQQLIQQGLGYRMPYMTRTAQFGLQTNVFNAAMNAPMTANGMQERQQATDTYAQQVQSQYSYFQSMLYQQREYDVQRTRAEQDYDTQRTYAQEDYNRQRSREEADFQLQRQRAEQDFNTQMQRGLQDYNIQRKREEQDHNYQVLQMVQQQAEAMYNMYTRIQTVRTSSANFLLYNSAQQTQAMQGQEKNLNTLRKEGLSDQAIQQMGLTDSNNAQQLSRLVAEVAGNPKMIQQFNEEVAKRLKAAGALVKDKSSQDWQQFEHQYKVSRDRAQQDFQKSVDRAHQDFQLQLSRQNQDFATSLDRQQQDYTTSMGRMEDSFNLSMQRSAEDLARSAQTIDGNFQQILTQATEKLGGHAGEMAKKVLSSFKDLKSSVSPAAVDLMTTLSNIFGFKYTPPADATGTNTNQKPDLRPQGTNGPRHSGQQTNISFTGGVLPGFSPGIDDHTFTSPTGGTLHLSGGEAIMRPEFVQKVGGAGAIAEMNRRAVQGFAAGGVYRPVQGPISQGPHDQYTGYTALDFGVPVGTTVYAVNSGTITQSYDIAGPLPTDSFHNAQYGPYGSYGRVMYLKTDGGPEVLYAHLSKRGFAAGAHVSGGQPIGLSGSTGNSSGPHLHFGDNDGNPMEFVTGARGRGIFAGSGVSSSSFTSSGHGKVPPLQKILKNRYPQPEAAARAMQGVHPLGPGDISSVINALATDVYKEWYGSGAIFNGPRTIGVGESGPEMVLPLNSHGSDFLAELMAKTSVGSAGRGVRSYGATPMVAHSVANYAIDRSTAINGPITVMANNPAEMFQQLKARQRLAALSQPTLGGTR